MPLADVWAGVGGGGAELTRLGLVQETGMVPAGMIQGAGGVKSLKGVDVAI